MDDLFSFKNEYNIIKNIPLAEKMRPFKLCQILGQEHITGKGKFFFEAIKKNKIPSLILYGPTGSGKTTLAKVIFLNTNSNFENINIVIDGISKIKDIIKLAEDNLKFYNKKTMIFIDEIHRLTKIQQDSLLNYIEKGLIILIGATTENPYIELNKAFLSRLLIFKLIKISKENIYKILEKALFDKINGYGKFKFIIKNKIKLFSFLYEISNGDTRKALNALENLITITNFNKDGSLTLTLEKAKNSIMQKTLSYDKNGDSHYDIISAFIKSIRGSDSNAAIHYLARMILSGEDPIFIARRLIILAAEDIGLADPIALSLATSCFLSVEKIGLPEAQIIIAEVVIYLSKAKKSNSAYIAIKKAINDIEEKNFGEVPDHLKNIKINTKKNKYYYPHDYPEKNYIIEQQYLPDNLKKAIYYKKKKFDK